MATTPDWGIKGRAAAWMLGSVAGASLVPTLAGEPSSLPTGLFLFASHLVSTIALALAALFAGRHREFAFYSSVDLRRLVALGGLGIFLYYTLLYDSYAPCAGDAPCAQRATVVMVLHYSWPIFAVLLSWVLLSEAPRWRTALAVLCGALALASVAAADAHGHAGTSAVPKALGAAAACGLYVTITKRVRFEPLTGFTIMFGAATALALAALLPMLGQSVPVPLVLDAATVQQVLLSGLVANAFPLVCWQRALRLAGDGFATPWQALTPVVAGAMYSVTSGAVPVRIQWIGLTLMLASAFLALYQPANDRWRPTPSSARPKFTRLAPRQLVEDSI